MSNSCGQGVNFKRCRCQSCAVGVSIPARNIRGETIQNNRDRLKILQSEYDKITAEIISLINSMDELRSGQDFGFGFIENKTRESSNVLDKLILDMDAFLEVHNIMNQDTVYSSPRDISLK